VTFGFGVKYAVAPLGLTGLVDVIYSNERGPATNDPMTVVSEGEIILVPQPGSTVSEFSYSEEGAGSAVVRQLFLPLLPE
jgi:hypothetical protein